MKVNPFNSYIVTEVISTNGGELLMQFVRDCLDGKKDDLYKGNQTDGMHLQAELESIVNKIGQDCFNAGFKEALKNENT